MAKIHEEIIIIKVSKLVKESDSPDPVVNDEIVQALATVAEELAGTGVVVEAEKAE